MVIPEIPGKNGLKYQWSKLGQGTWWEPSLNCFNCSKIDAVVLESSWSSWELAGFKRWFCWLYPYSSGVQARSVPFAVPLVSDGLHRWFHWLLWCCCHRRRNSYPARGPVGFPGWGFLRVDSGRICRFFVREVDRIPKRCVWMDVSDWENENSIPSHEMSWVSEYLNPNGDDHGFEQRIYVIRHQSEEKHLLMWRGELPDFWLVLVTASLACNDQAKIEESFITTFRGSR